MLNRFQLRACNPYLLKTLKGDRLNEYVRHQTMAIKTPEIKEGVIYYNAGFKMLVRLAVSLSTLRKVYSGPCTILADYDSYNHCKIIADKFGASVGQANFDKHRKNTALLNKCRLAEISPYNPSIFIDSDTIIFKDFTRMFEIAKHYEFVATNFCDWTAKSRRIQKRIKAWLKHMPKTAKKALNYQYSINTGVFAFMKQSLLMENWYDHAVKGEDLYIPDETCCQTIIHAYPHYVIDSTYNQSCRYEGVTSATKILHYHGRKHCRLDNDGNFMYNGNFWFDAFSKIKEFVEPWIRFDRQLRKALITLEKK